MQNTEKSGSIRRYRWVLFDQGGTLFEPLPRFYSERNQRLAVRELGHFSASQQPALADLFQQARRASDAAFLKRGAYRHQQLVTEHLLRGLIALQLCRDSDLERYQSSGYLTTELDQIAQRYFDRQCRAVLDQLRLKPDCHPVLRALADRARLAIVSNNATEYLQPLVARYRLDQFMEQSMCSDELGACKPDAEIFNRALRQLGIAERERSQILYVGDSVEFDVVGAKSAGLDVALVSSTNRAIANDESVGRHYQPTYHLATLSELELLV